MRHLRAKSLAPLGPAPKRICGCSAGAVDCQSPKIADNACGARSLPARTMAGIPPSAGTLYLVSPQGGCQNSKAAKPLRILQYFRILRQRQAGRPQKERAAGISLREYAGPHLPPGCGRRLLVQFLRMLSEFGYITGSSKETAAGCAWGDPAHPAAA